MEGDDKGTHPCILGFPRSLAHPVLRSWSCEQTVACCLTWAIPAPGPGEMKKWGLGLPLSHLVGTGALLPYGASTAWPW